MQLEESDKKEPTSLVFSSYFSSGFTCFLIMGLFGSTGFDGPKGGIELQLTFVNVTAPSLEPSPFWSKFPLPLKRSGLAAIHVHRTVRQLPVTSCDVSIPTTV